MPQESNDYRVTILGAAGVGKSCLVQRFICGSFKEHHVPTVEDTYRKVISSNRQLCTLQITDTTGSYQFPAMQRLAIQRSHAFVLVYSVTSRRSLDELTSIFEEIVEIKGDTDLIPVMLVGNKADEEGCVPAATGDVEVREVQRADGILLANRWRCAFLETSARMSKNVESVFEQLLQLERRRSVSIHQASAGGKMSRGRARSREAARKAAGKAAGMAAAVGRSGQPAPSTGTEVTRTGSAYGFLRRATGCAVM